MLMVYNSIFIELIQDIKLNANKILLLSILYHIYNKKIRLLGEKSIKLNDSEKNKLSIIKVGDLLKEYEAIFKSRNLYYNLKDLEKENLLYLDKNNIYLNLRPGINYKPFLSYAVFKSKTKFAYNEVDNSIFKKLDPVDFLLLTIIFNYSNSTKSLLFQKKLKHIVVEIFKISDRLFKKSYEKLIKADYIRCEDYLMTFNEFNKDFEILKDTPMNKIIDEEKAKPNLFLNIKNSLKIKKESLDNIRQETTENNNNNNPTYKNKENYKPNFYNKFYKENKVNEEERDNFIERIKKNDKSDDIFDILGIKTKKK